MKSRLMTFEYFSSGPDLAGVKDAAKKLAGSPEFRRALSRVSPSLLHLAARELKSLVAKWGSVERLAGHLVAKAQSTNEGSVATLVFSAIGIHYLLKLLIELKRGFSPRTPSEVFLGQTMPGYETGGVGPMGWTLRKVRDMLITLATVMCALAYFSRDDDPKYVKFMVTSGPHKGREVELTFRFRGIDDLAIGDETIWVKNPDKTLSPSDGRLHMAKRRLDGSCEIMHDGKIIGLIRKVGDSTVITDTAGKEVLRTNQHEGRDLLDDKLKILRPTNLKFREPAPNDWRDEGSQVRWETADDVHDIEPYFSRLTRHDIDHMDPEEWPTSFGYKAPRLHRQLSHKAPRLHRQLSQKPRYELVDLLSPKGK